jgi:hypothetical protein
MSYLGRKDKPNNWQNEGDKDVWFRFHGAHALQVVRWPIPGESRGTHWYVEVIDFDGPSTTLCYAFGNIPVLCPTKSSAMCLADECYPRVPNGLNQLAWMRL